MRRVLPTSAASFSRRGALIGALALAACGRKGEAEPKPPAAKAARNMTLQDAVAGEWRPAADKARDPWRHPVETLEFWGLKPGQTVVEFWPGAGWYTDILAPYLAANKGKLIAANLEPADPASTEIVEAYRARLKAKPKIYGDVEITAFGPTSGPVAPAGGADLVLFLRNLHNWMAAGIAEKAFRDAFAALKPGGVLGIEEHRAAPGGVQDVLAADGYVQEAYVVRLAQEAGFVLDKTSEINANASDTRDHPFGVWTLPPVRLTAPRGEPADPNFDRAPYDAIGESDRMTLRLVKPAS
ncbi:methyltransferase [Phenylobacterium sp. Root77]|jgi:predicted methyltransferase|uniref:class I SAM-dependent methyltransferase n=1 Tax=unclassified Phenylobacterium TaxID=2640670 RepID=UPI0006FEA95C|nr:MULTISPECIES: class I SAM-dependent methyltransferase [unclassified Phenylobacterium]KQW73212.1 methyltransferase [Phenylobacterium sp. Root1277]KQW92432.1 methyltransferase [Phenylobacterium sp. Root1290]KRC40661.1 methyltransferase [Phenylobacterium sp. Root77]